MQLTIAIAIAGAGLAGVTASAALAAKGHAVAVYERREDQDRDVSARGIHLRPNALRMLAGLGMMGVEYGVAHESGGADLREYRTGETVGVVDILRWPAVRLSNGERVVVDLVVGADGPWPRVRKSLFPDHRPTATSSVCF